jgi:hypothetical protein
MAAKKAKSVQLQKEATSLKKINELRTCINKDRSQLDKLYQKACANTNKDVISIQKLLAKTKKQAQVIKRNKKANPKAHQDSQSDIHSLNKQFTIIKHEQQLIKAEYAKFIAEQKALIQFEKAWDKKASGSKKTKSSKSPKKTTKKIMSDVVPLGIG